MNLETFLTSFFSQLNIQKIQHCILRNYEGLPFENPGNDIDILMARQDAFKALSVLYNMNEIVITGIAKRYYVISVFVNGVVWGNNYTSIQIDLVTLLGFKGLPFLSVKTVLSDSIIISGTSQLLKKPNSVHEAIISLYSSYVVGGWIKKKYQTQVRMVFNNERKKVLNALSLSLPKPLCHFIVDGVISNDENLLMDKLPEIRKSLIINNFKRHPLQSLKAVLDYSAAEIKIRFTPYYVDTICFLGPDGSGKSSVISCITEMLKNTTKEIKYKHLKPKLFNKNNGSSIVTDPHAKPPRSTFISIIKIMYWLFLYWYDRFNHKHKNLTLRIWDRYYYDLIVDPLRYRYGAPIWIAHLIAKLVPKPDLIILLDTPATVLQNRKQEVSFEEMLRQRRAYIKLMQQMNNGFIVDASQNMEKVVEETRKIIINLMARKAKNRLGF